MDIEGRIIAILSDSQIVINKGRVDGVALGMIFGIKLILPEIIDPEDSSNKISGLFYEKGEGEVQRILDRMAFVKLIGKKIYNASISEVLNQGLKIEYPPVTGEAIIKKSDWVIRVGDSVFLKKAQKAP
jgi:hypothetical protein